jgi:dTDP-4-amino-4,6-dideoxygalactose transaminase
MKENKKVFVTQPFLPPLKEFLPYLEQIWKSHQLTNNGPFHQQLEQELCKYLGVKYISLFSNGTLALITALQALRITGEVITTPFSFVATTHALWWNNIKPVFVDIEPDTFTLDPQKIEQAITPQTTAILPVHVYGYPCRVDEIERIAKRHKLKVIYDAAHTFGARLNGQSLCSFGDLSILSFHATKVFNTFEGGAIVCHDAKMKHHIDNLKNFGFRGELVVEEPGINAKMNEIQAAMGLLQLKYIEIKIAKRKMFANIYRDKLKGIEGLTLPNELPNVKQCYSYFPILIEKEKFGISRDDLYEKLKSNNVFSRRYFYPLISQFNPYRDLPSANPINLPVAERIAEQVLCLPIYSELKKYDIDKILLAIKKNL